jgi:hypothetical protein
MKTRTINIISFYTNVQQNFCFTLIFALLIFIYTPNTKGATRTFTGPGHFSQPSKWNGGTLPSAGDNLVIKNACTIDQSVLTDNIAYGTLTLGSSGTLGSITWHTISTNRLKVGNITSTVAGGFINMINGGTLILTGTWTPANCAFHYGTGTVEVQSAITMPSSYVNYYKLIINSSGTVNTGANTTINSTLKVNAGNYTVGAHNLTVVDSAVVNSTLTLSSTTGTKTFSNLIVNGSFTNSANEAFTIDKNLVNNGTMSNGTGRVTFTGAASNTVSGTAPTTAFGGGITVNKGTSNTNILDVQSVITMMNGGLVLTNGTFKVSSASTITPFIADIVPSPYLIPSTAGLWCNGATFSASANSWSLQGLLRVSAGTIYVGNAAGHWLAPRTGATIIVEGGSLIAADRISQFNETSTFTMTGGTVIVPSVSSSSAGRPPFNLELAGSSFSMSGGTMIIRQKGGSAGQNLGFTNLAAGGTGFTGGTLQIGDASTPASQTIKIITSTPIYNLTVASPNATATVFTNPITVVNDLTITSGILDANNLNISVGGDWTNNSASGDPFVQGTGTVTFNGSSAQTISSTTGTETFYNLSFANSGGGISTINSTDIIATNILDFTSGIVTTGSDLVIHDNSTANNLTYTNGFINGNLRRYISSNTDTYLFPVGDGTNSSNRHRLSFINNALTGVSYLDGNVENFIQSAPNSDASLNTSQWGTNISSTIGEGAGETMLWSLIPNASPSGGNFGVQLYVENTGVNGSNDNTFAPLMRIGNSTFADFLSYEGTTTLPGYNLAGRIYNSGSGYAQRTGYSSFGQFTIGVFVGTLPVELVNFKAIQNEDVVDLTWMTASEINNNFFTIEHSLDGKNYKQLFNVEGSGNSTIINEYKTVDPKPYKGLAFYRLKQTDFDGKSTYSEPVSVHFIDGGIESYFYPNPFSSTATLAINSGRKIENSILNIYSSIGEVTRVESTSTIDNKIRIERNNLSSGIYYYELTENGNVISKGKMKVE